MPIIGLTDQGARFPRIGVLRKGSKKTAKRPGEDLEFFRVDSESPDVLEDFRHAYGEEPNHIRFFFPYPNIEENWQAWQEEYVAGGLVHRCDGREMEIWKDEKSGEYATAAENGKQPCPYLKKARSSKHPGCKPVGRLSILVPELRRMATFTVLTTSQNDIIEIQGNIEQAFKLQGTLTGIPFILSRVQKMVSTPETGSNGKRTGKRIRRLKWMLQIEPAPDWVDGQIKMLEEGLSPRLALKAESEVADAARMLEADMAGVNPETGEVVDVDVEIVEGDGPLQPEQRIAALLADAEHFDSLKMAKPTATQTGVIVRNLETVLDGKGNRYAFLQLVFGVNTSKDLSRGQWKALAEWLSAEMQVVGEEEKWVMPSSVYEEAGMFEGAGLLAGNELIEAAKENEQSVQNDSQEEAVEDAEFF